MSMNFSLSVRVFLLKMATAFFNKMYREFYSKRLLDTILNSIAEAILFKITRRDG